MKTELKRRHVTYAELPEKLGKLGVHGTAENIANKISRGSFAAAFLIQHMHAIEAQTLRLSDQDRIASQTRTNQFGRVDAASATTALGGGTLSRLIVRTKPPR